MIRLIAIFGLSSCFIFPASAQDIDCNNIQSQVESTYCAGVVLNRADAELNAAYRSAVASAKRLDNEGQFSAARIQDLLRDAQRAWIPFRDSACDAEASLAQGGTGQSQFYLECKTRLTRERTKDLRIFSDR